MYTHMRLFLAIKLPEEVKLDIHNQLEPLRDEYPAFKWISYQNYHINLFFFGKAEESKVEPLSKMIEKGVYNTPSFRLYSGTIGRFIKNNIDLYIGFQKNHAIEAMIKQLKEAFGIEDELTFFPHLAIARYKLPSKQQYLLIKKKFTQFELEFEFDVTQITLYNSVIESRKTHYEIVKEFALYAKS